MNLTKEIIEKSYSFSDVCRNLDCYMNGRIIKEIKQFIEKNNIDISHFDRSKLNRKWEKIIKKCPVCGESFETQKGHLREKTTCSFSCANTYFRSGKNREHYNKKVSETLKRKYKNGEIKPINGELKSTYKRKCVICENSFTTKKINQICCSRKCNTIEINRRPEVKEKIRKSMFRRIKNGQHKGWQSRNILSYSEKFFRKVLQNNELLNKCKINYSVNKRKLGLDENGNYFLDFYFPDKKLDLEIDGKQHRMEDRRLFDKKRDETLINNNIIVYRIKWNEINSDEGKMKMKIKINNFLDFYNRV